MKILFIYLDAFSQVGGIQSFNKAFMKALQLFDEEGTISFKALSLYDSGSDSRYINNINFRGFNHYKLSFIIEALFRSFQSNLIIIGHINLAPLGLLLKKLNRKVYVIAHGVDVWGNISLFKEKFLLQCDSILSVSDFTKQQLISNLGVNPEKIKIFPNTLDPYFNIPDSLQKSVPLRNKYDLKDGDKVILTVSRLSYEDQHKGYDKVISVLPELLIRIPNIKYLIVGGGDSGEVSRVKKQIHKLDLDNNVILAGCVPNEELKDYYLSSDVFVMPSKKEGFGIVYLESLASGVPVIAGNKDGSASPLLNGKFGFLIDPDDKAQLAETIISVLSKNVQNTKLIDPEYLSSIVYLEFGYEKFRARLSNILKEIE